MSLLFFTSNKIDVISFTPNETPEKVKISGFPSTLPIKFEDFSRLLFLWDLSHSDIDHILK